MMTKTPGPAVATTAKSRTRMQCVEYARHWLKENRGLSYANVRIAADIWDRVNHYTRLSDGGQLSVLSILNGATQTPTPSDLIVYSEKFLNTGHVAVVIAVDINAQVIVVREQNFANEYQSPDHTREIPFIFHNERYWILDAYVLGWKQLRTATD